MRQIDISSAAAAAATCGMSGVPAPGMPTSEGPELSCWLWSGHSRCRQIGQVCRAAAAEGTWGVEGHVLCLLLRRAAGMALVQVNGLVLAIGPDPWALAMPGLCYWLTCPCKTARLAHQEKNP